MSLSPHDKLCVPMPQSTQYIYRGTYEVKQPTTTPIAIRWTENDRWFVTEQASRLGITFSEFVRWVAYHAAKEVERAHIAQTFKLDSTPKVAQPINMDEYE